MGLDDDPDDDPVIITGRKATRSQHEDRITGPHQYSDLICYRRLMP